MTCEVGMRKYTQLKQRIYRKDRKLKASSDKVINDNTIF